MAIESAEKVAPSFRVPAAGSVAPYRTFNQLLRGMIAAILMLMWGASLVIGIFLLQPDTRQLAGVLMVLAVPILFVSALPIVYRYWVKNWQLM